MSRSRWAAIGAAVAVTLGAGGIGITHATTSSGEKPVYIPLDEPCRLADNRPGGIGADSSATFDGWGMVGDCDLPTGTSGLALNVTAVGATQQTNLRFYPADADVPGTANLNPTPGAPPIPNAVNVALDATGKFKVYNRFGTVAVVIDVMGVYDDHNHDDRYYTEAEVDAAVAPKANSADVYTKSEADAAHAASAGVDYSTVNINVPLDNPDITDLQSLEVTVPADGYLIINATSQLVGEDGTSVVCSVGTAPTTQGPVVTGVQFLGGAYITNFALTGGIPVSAGTVTLYHNCRQDTGVDGDAIVQQSALTVVFSANRL